MNIINSGSIDESHLLPGSIFGSRTPVKQQDQKRVIDVADHVFKLLQDGQTPTKGELRSYIVEASKGDIKIAHVALKILLMKTLNPVVESDIKSIDAEFCSILFNPIQKSISHTLEHVSPREVSLQEGELPAIPQEHRRILTSYLKSEITIGNAINELGLNKDSAREILQSIKIIDLETDRLSPKEKSDLQFTETTYELRTLCLQASEGEMNSYEAYTKSINPKYFENQFSLIAREYSRHEHNYIPERIRDHARISQNYAIEMMQLSTRLDLPSRVFYCIGGNCGVGKSRCAKTDDAFRKGLVDEEIVGALSLDTLKGKLRKGVSKVTNQQVHAEGWVLAQKLAKELKTKAVNASVVIDERLGTVPAIKEIAEDAERTGAKMRYKDIDGSLLLSALRVIGRDIKTEPCMPYHPISSGQKILREQRREVIEMARTNTTFESYQLFVADEDGMQVLAAEKKDGSFTVYDQALLEKSMQVPSEKEISETKDTVISDAFLARAATMTGVKVEALLPYKGLTIEQALEAHSKELPEYH